MTIGKGCSNRFLGRATARDRATLGHTLPCSVWKSLPTQFNAAQLRSFMEFSYANDVFDPFLSCQFHDQLEPQVNRQSVKFSNGHSKTNYKLEKRGGWTSCNRVGTGSALWSYSSPNFGLHQNDSGLFPLKRKTTKTKMTSKNLMTNDFERHGMSPLKISKNFKSKLGASQPQRQRAAQRSSWSSTTVRSWDESAQRHKITRRVRLVWSCQVGRKLTFCEAMKQGHFFGTKMRSKMVNKCLKRNV